MWKWSASVDSLHVGVISVGVCNGWNGRFRYLLECVMVGMEGSDICWSV